jgi:hypothetical protein
MTSPSQSSSDPVEVAQRRRRGVLGGLAALAAGFLAARTVSPGHAADGEPLRIGNMSVPPGAQSARSTTELNPTNPTLIDDALRVSNDNGDALSGSSTVGAGVVGSSTSDIGVVGTSAGSSGVLGVSTASNGTGVVGEANNGLLARGVVGRSTSGAGVEVWPAWVYGVACDGLVGVRGASRALTASGLKA